VRKFQSGTNYLQKIIVRDQVTQAGQCHLFAAQCLIGPAQVIWRPLTYLQRMPTCRLGFGHPPLAGEVPVKTYLN
jgi:hypothetical protein